jgi:hypothetical protein
MTKTVTLTLEQAEIALRCVEASIIINGDAVNHDELEIDFSDVHSLTFYLRRAELAQRLNTAINNAMKETK